MVTTALPQRYEFGASIGNAIAFFHEHAVELSGLVRPSISEINALPTRLTHTGTHEERHVLIKCRPVRFDGGGVKITLHRQLGTDEWQVVAAKSAAHDWRSVLVSEPT